MPVPDRRFSGPAPVAPVPARLWYLPPPAASLHLAASGGPAAGTIAAIRATPPRQTPPPRRPFPLSSHPSHPGFPNTRRESLPDLSRTPPASCKNTSSGCNPAAPPHPPPVL